MRARTAFSSSTVAFLMLAVGASLLPDAAHGQERIRQRPRPDLILETSQYEGLVRPGTFNTLGVLVRNKGMRPTEKCVRVRVTFPQSIASISTIAANFRAFLCDGGQCSASNVEAICDMKPLAPNETVGLEIRFHASAVGGSIVQGLVDPDNTIREMYEGNNTLTRPLAVARY